MEQNERLEIPDDAGHASPQPGDWKESPEAVHLCVNKARCEAWDRCKKKVETLRGNLQKTPQVTHHMDEGLPVDQALFECLLGPKSKQGRLTQKATGFDKPTHCRFMCAFLLSCQTNQSLPNTHKNGGINTEFLMSLKECNLAWRKTSKAGEVRTAWANR